jgi:VCBS repeat-containing protein
LAVGAVATAAVATVVVVVVATGDEPEVAEPAPTTTTTVVPEPEVAVPTPGPGLFETVAAGTFDGNLLDGVDQNTEAGSLMIIGLEGQPTNVGQPFTLASGATLTVDPLGGFQYVSPPSAGQLPAGETMVDSFTYTVTNVDGFLEDWTAQVTVVGENQAPVVSEIPALSVTEGESTSAALDAVDVEGEALTFSLEEGAPSFVSVVTADDGTAQLEIAPGADAAGSYEFVVTATDGAQPPQTGSATVNLTVEAAPEVPERVTENLLARYDFNEAEGASVREQSGAGLGSALTVADPGAISWGDGGLTINQPTILTAGPASGVIDAIKTSGSFTVEAWVTPANNTQSGPARVVSISSGTGQRNVSLSQGEAEADGGSGDHWSSRQRATETSVNGLPELAAPSGTAVAGQRSHVVLTRSADGEVRLYVDSVQVASGTAAGDLSTWDSSFSLVMANETSGDRPWLGTLHLVALYSSALSDAEVTQNYEVGAS